MSAFVKSHHAKEEFCQTRAKYREGRELKAVKVYTINHESAYLLVQGVPALGLQRELLKLFTKYGAISEHQVLHEYPSEEFTEVHRIKYERIQSARVAKKKSDDQSFYGGVLHICYAPEFESIEETRQKLQERRKVVSRRVAQLESERRATSSTETSTESHEATQAALTYSSQNEHTSQAALTYSSQNEHTTSAALTFSSHNGERGENNKMPPPPQSTAVGMGHSTPTSGVGFGPVDRSKNFNFTVEDGINSHQQQTSYQQSHMPQRYPSNHRHQPPHQPQHPGHLPSPHPPAPGQLPPPHPPAPRHLTPPHPPAPRHLTPPHPPAPGQLPPSHRLAPRHPTSPSPHPPGYLPHQQPRHNHAPQHPQTLHHGPHHIPRPHTPVYGQPPYPRPPPQPADNMPYPPILPPPPQQLSPWQPTKARPRFDHARVPSAHATLPAWMGQPTPPWQQIDDDISPWQQGSNSNVPSQESSHDSSIKHSDKVTLKNDSEQVHPAELPSHKHRDQESKGMVIKDYKSKGAKPKFVPRQVAKKDIPGLSKEEFRRSIKDAVNESLRQNAFILDEMKGPSLPSAQEEKRQHFKVSDTGDKSIDDTVLDVRTRVKQFSTTFLPRQVKKQRTS